MRKPEENSEIVSLKGRQADAEEIATEIIRDLDKKFDRHIAVPKIAEWVLYLSTQD